MAVLIIWPLIRFELKAFDDGGSGFSRAWNYDGIGRVAFNTLALAIGSVVIALTLGTLLAWLTMRVPPRWNAVVALMPVAPLMLPAVAKVQSWTYLLSPRTGIINRWLREIGLGSGTRGPLDIYTMPGIVIISGFTLTSFVFLFVSASLRQRGTELEAAASTCGASGPKIFFTVTLPLLRPALVYSGGITFLLALGQFTAPLLLGGPRHIEVVSTVMYQVSSEYPQDFGMGAALATPLLAIGIFIVFVQRRALRDAQRFVSVSGRSRHVLTKTSHWALLPIGLYLLFAVVLPMFALISVSLSPFWSGRVEPSKFTLSHWENAFSDAATRQALTTTAIALAITLALVVPLGYLAAYAQNARTQVPKPVRVAIDALSSVSLSMPAVLLGFAFLVTWSGAPFKLYGSTAIIVIAYVTLMLPHAIRPQLASMMSVGPEYAEASRVCGAGPFTTARKIGFPLIRSGIGVAVSIVIILIIHEFAVSLMVTSPQRRVVGTLLYDATNFGTAPQVAVVALLMVAITSVGLIFALIVGGARAVDRI
jgi:iron(III) transport system permease protein